MARESHFNVIVIASVAIFFVVFMVVSLNRYAPDEQPRELALKLEKVVEDDQSSVSVEDATPTDTSPSVASTLKQLREQVTTLSNEPGPLDIDALQKRIEAADMALAKAGIDLTLPDLPAPPPSPQQTRLDDLQTRLNQLQAQ